MVKILIVCLYELEVLVCCEGGVVVVLYKWEEIGGGDVYGSGMCKCRFMGVSFRGIGVFGCFCYG